MARPAGRDQATALLRLVRILTMLANASPSWVNRDRIIEAVGYHSANLEDQRDQLRRDLRHLGELGWRIEGDDRQGEDARLRLLDQDPRLATLLTAPQLGQLARAARATGKDPASLGLPPVSTGSPRVPVALRRSDAYRLETALHALHHRCVLHVTYNDRQRDLEVDRVFQTSTGRWRVVARSDGEQKQYRLDRFQAVSVDRPGTASAPQADLTSPDPLGIADGDPITAVVRIPLEHERHALRELGRPLDRLVEGDEAEVRIRVVNRPLWRARLYQLGERVRLIGPEELRDEVRADLLAFCEGAA